MTNNTKQVPLIAHVIYRLDTGGLENGLVNLINTMPPEKYRHIIICLKGSSSFRERLQRNIDIIDLEKKEGQDWSSFVRLYKVLKQYKVDIIHTRNLGTIEYQVPALLAGVKYRVHGEHGWDTFDPDGNNKKYQWVRRVLSPLIQVFIPLSMHLQNYLLDKVKVSSSKIVRICNGVDTHAFFPVSGKQALENCPLTFDKNNIYIGTVGRMHGVKDQITLVNAFNILMQENPELKGRVYLLLVGDGPLKEQATQLLKQYGLYDSAWLSGARNDISDIMQHLDVFVLPSQAEGISNTILEAMATGLAVVATNVGGTPELVKQNETGILVAPSNPKEMADALSELIHNSEKRIEQGKQSYQRVLDHFSIQAMVNNYINVYDSLMIRK